MALIGNGSLLNKSFQRVHGGTTTALSVHGNTKPLSMTTGQLRARAQGQFTRASIPGTGYGPGSAFMLPMKAGELGARRIDGAGAISGSALSAMIVQLDAISGQATVLGFANAIGLITIAGTSSGVGSASAFTLVASSMSGSITAQATVQANLGAVIPCEASSAGVASSSVNLKGRGRLNGVISIGASGYLSNDDVERLSEAVWDILISEHSTTGTTGKALADAGGAGNPWAADTSTNNDPGTFGERVQKLLTTTQFRAEKE